MKDKMEQSKKLLYVVAEDHYFLSHRLPMAQAAQQAGYQVLVAAPPGKSIQQIEAKGFKFYPLHHFDRTSISFLQEFKALNELVRLYRFIKPIVVHHVAIKPVLYGSLAASFCKLLSLFKKNSQPYFDISVVNALGGLGYIFISSSIKAWALRVCITTLFRFLLNRPRTILILQNTDDQQTLVSSGCLDPAKSIIIRGSGVDTDFYNVVPEPPVGKCGPIIAYVGRMLKDKGIGELVEAIRILHTQGVQAQFYLYGDIDFKNPASLTVQQLQEWQEEGLIIWKKTVPNSRQAYQDAHIAVLPSYREGLPKSLLEAGSCGRPIVTTNVPGCRDVVQNDFNGFCVACRPSRLADALKKLIYDKNLRQTMGAAGRQRVLENFSNDIIIRQMHDLYSQMLP